MSSFLYISITYIIECIVLPASTKYTLLLPKKEAVASHKLALANLPTSLPTSKPIPNVGKSVSSASHGVADKRLLAGRREGGGGGNLGQGLTA
jgi:hypothetical protein